MSSSAAADRVTVKLMLGSVPSVAGLGVPLEIETVGSAWSSTMLPVPSASVMPAARWCCPGQRGAERWTVNASGVSKTASFRHGDGDGGGGRPARMVTVPSVAPVKSVPATAVPLTVIGDRVLVGGRSRVTVKVMLLPSVAGLGVPLEIETVGWPGRRRCCRCRRRR